jgi:Protein of unknown function (DUF1439)
VQHAENSLTATNADRPKDITMNKILLALVVLLVSACAAMIPKTHVVTHAQLEQKLAKSFPLRRDVAKGLFSATINQPHLILQPAKNRVELVGDFSTYSVLGSNLAGQFMLSSALRFDPAERAVFLHEARLESFVLSQDSQSAERLKPLLNMMLNEYFKTSPLYRFQADELRFSGKQIDITGIEIIPEGIRLTLQAADATHHAP